ncbi:hypothetical protein [Spelaeicoccus albus]|uniref:Uncharacterized protein n=1 Tax=Spelaeicoccus albus TaxID=1280376 RepID=A0A7Z0D4Z2_9MICO|nr:hypothetical protein [Spelaeicoccus albus]NYI68935.1 hypothetical protein [Spelaeicoccus albus]
MSTIDALPLPDAETWQDLRTFALRAKRLDESGAIRLSVTGNVLAVIVAPLYGSFLGDPMPTVLGMRTLRVVDGTVDGLDAVVSLASMTDRFARGLPGDLLLPVPPTQVHAPWAGITPPRGGWEHGGGVAADILIAEAKQGIDSVAGALPDRPGAPVLSEVRRHVWGEPVAGMDIPRGAAFAADGLGFLTPGEIVATFAAGPWQRISTDRGHVLARG